MKAVLFLMMVSVPLISVGQESPTSQVPLKQRPPIIDIHFHPGGAMTTQQRFCLWFFSDMPGVTDPDAPYTETWDTGCVDPIVCGPMTADEVRKAYIETFERLNITAVAMNSGPALFALKNAIPDRIIPGIGVSNTTGITVDAMRDSIATGFYKVMGECAPQYNGISPSDMSLDPYFAIAEKYDIPVGFHMGTGGGGSANIEGSKSYHPKFTAQSGNPIELEDLLHRHPDLRVWVMHCGYPFTDELIAVMAWNAYVFVDLSGFITSYPLEEVNMVIKRLVQAGFGKRLMWGSDALCPKMIEASISVIENAGYLTPEQKRDILYNNAARFLRLNK
jgi:uncharacterized protein